MPRGILHVAKPRKIHRLISHVTKVCNVYEKWSSKKSFVKTRVKIFFLKL